MRKAFFVFWKIVSFSLLLTLCILILSFLFQKWILPKEDAAPVVAEEKEKPLVILDAGHGGMDSGAVSVLGDEEKYLNLAVTKKLGEFLEAGGVRVIYTRSEDTMLTSPEAVSRKSGDLMARAALAREHPEALFVSIHMNTLPIEKYKGLQVFYSENTGTSKALAQSIQNDVASLLQPDNHREAKNAEGKIYLLDRIQTPAVLIECGFLSNREEASLLIQEEYQGKLAYTLSRSLLHFLKQKDFLE